MPVPPKPELLLPDPPLGLPWRETVGNRAEVNFVLEIPFMRLRTVDGIPTMVAAFTTDIPGLPNWGEPVLLGPGSIHVAHTERERLEKRQLHEAVELYGTVAKKLMSGVVSDNAC